MTPENEELVRRLEKDGILQPVTLKWLRDQTVNGGIPIICSDGSIDARQFFRRAVPEANVVQIFGGPVVLSPSYRDHDEAGAKFLLRNMDKGRRLKKTGTSFPHYHWPCGDLLELKYAIEDIFLSWGQPQTRFSWKRDGEP